MSREPFDGWAETTLGGIGLFCGVDSETLLQLGRRALWRQHPAGTAVIRAGDVRTSFLALIEGTVSVRFVDERTTGTSDAGAVLGLRLALRHEPSPVHMVAMTPVRVAEIARGDLLHVMCDCPELARNVAAFVAGRGPLDQPRAQIDARIVAALARAARPGAGLMPLPAPVDTAVWATLLGVDKIDVDRALRRLERQGLVERRPGGRHLVDAAALRRRLA